MARRADSFLFRAQAVSLNWEEIARQKLSDRQQHVDGRLAFHDQKSLSQQMGDIRLTWACAKELGVPRGPFTVWTRPRSGDKLGDTRLVTFSQDNDLGLWWGGIEAAVVSVSCTVVDPSRPVALFLYRTAPSLHDSVAAQAIQPVGPGVVQLRVHTSGATLAVLVNGANPTLMITPLDDVVNDPNWRPLEIVGLPVDQPWAPTAYDTADQGPVAAPVPPIEAAVMRLLRGGPMVGWSPVTESGHPAPPWSAPDPKLLVEEVRSDLLGEIAALYDGATREYQQFAITTSRAVDGPQQDARQSSLATSLDSSPWALLLLPALTDPFLNLAMGFGSAYSFEALGPDQIAVGNSDFLVTAQYENLMPPDRGPAEMAAYCPRPIPHGIVADPTGLTVERSGLVAPVQPDAPWRESIRLTWDRLTVTAALGNLTESAIGRFPPTAGAPAESLLPKRSSGGWRPLVITPDGQPGDPGNDRVSVVDGGAEIVIGSGGRTVGYTVAVSDVYGVWSSWQDVPYVGDEPAPQPPRVISLQLSSHYTGTTTCPAKLTSEISVEWIERTPTAVEVVAIFFPMALATSAPPIGIAPTAPAPAGCFRRDLSLTFVGDDPTGSGCSVISLSADGDQPMTPGPGQGDGGRRYQVTADVPVLDFGGTLRWGVQLWARRSLLVGASPSAYAPDNAHPALATAASPVPVVPLPPPAPPGVPLGSTNDAQGCSHVRVHWSLPGGADVRTNVVWEVAETSLRQRCGLSSRAPEADSPGVRLAALWNAYDLMTPVQRRNAFRRVRELDGATHDLDFTLPKGSTDIHLFVVTTVTSTGVDSPWPEGPGAPHLHLQAVIAPRLRQPSPPLLRSSIADDGTVTIVLHAASSIPVTGFKMFRTRSETAARNSETMGPAFATVTVDSPTPSTTDSFTGQPVYTATAVLAFPTEWDAWLVRAVAVPVDSVPVEGVLGLPSQACDVVSILVPPAGPPDLGALTFDLWGADHRGVVVHSSTTAPARPVTLGSHRLSATAGTQRLPITAIQDLAETPLTAPPPGAATAVVLQRGARAGGSSPLALWFTRPVAADPVDVTMRLVDPLGRSTEHVVTVPGWVAPPPVDLQIVAVTPVVGRGVILALACDAPIANEPPYVIEVRAVQRSVVFPRRRLPPVAAVNRVEIADELRQPAQEWFGPVRGRQLTASFSFDEIPLGVPPFQPGPRIQILRRPGHPLPGTANYVVWVPLAAPLRIDVTVVGPDGGRVSVSVSR